MAEPTWEVRQGDALALLREMPDESVHCCVTSPPYWGLRDYGEDGQLGLEPTPEEYVARMVEVFGEVRRVLRSDAVCFLNLGDSYAGSWGAQGRNGQMADRSVISARQIEAHPQTKSGTGSLSKTPGLKPKDLVGIPWRVAFALQSDGWWLRSDIIWSKPNPMPESVRDRPTKSHEYVFLLSRAERYFYDADAVAEESIHAGAHVRTNGNEGMDAGYDGHRTRDGLRRGVTVGPTRNRRSVWEITTRPYPAAHFAVFPPELPEVCIKAGTSQKGCCPECGAPWERVVERETQPEAYPDRKYDRSDPMFATKRNMGARYQAQLDANPLRTTGWRPTCPHDSEPVPCTVLDPFSGAGTTGVVSHRLGRSYIGLDLSPEYVEMSRRRIATATKTMPEDGWEPTHGDLPLFGSDHG